MFIDQSVARLRGDAKDRVMRCDGLELAEGRSRTDREVRACTGRQVEVAPQDRRTVSGRDLVQTDLLAPTVAKLRPPARRADIGSRSAAWRIAPASGALVAVGKRGDRVGV
jgi:hypothetical protein